MQNYEKLSKILEMKKNCIPTYAINPYTATYSILKKRFLTFDFQKLHLFRILEPYEIILYFFNLNFCKIFLWSKRKIFMDKNKFV